MKILIVFDLFLNIKVVYANANGTVKHGEMTLNSECEFCVKVRLSDIFPNVWTDLSKKNLVKQKVNQKSKNKLKVSLNFVDFSTTKKGNKRTDLIFDMKKNQIDNYLFKNKNYQQSFETNWITKKRVNLEM